MGIRKAILGSLIAVGGVLSLIAGGASASAVTNYVALGDSFSAGAGSGIFPGQLVEDRSVYGATLDKCNRSSVAYPPKLASQRAYALTNVSCGGATTDNIMTTGQFGEPAQITAVAPSTNVVTVTIGGNDIGFSDIVTCIVASECTTSSPAVVNADAKIGTLQQKVLAVLNAVHAQAPSAKIALAGYPRIVPTADRSAIGCQPWLSKPEQTLANSLQVNVNGLLQGAVSQAAASGANAVYVDPLASTSPFEGRDWVGLKLDACSLSAGRQINGIRADFPAGSFHPNKFGQESYTTLFNRAL